MSTVTFKVSNKGSAKSGNYLHAGRPGKVGGSTAYSIGGKTAGEWKDAQDKLSAEGHAKLMDGLAQAGVDNDKAKAFADRLDEHRSAVMDEAFEIAASDRYDLSRADQATLTSNLLKHDYDKYDPAVAMAYINKATDSKGFWNAVVEHHDNASHHPESWQTSRDRADRMPYPYAIEMVGDWVATAKYHNSPIDAYYNKNKHSFVLHPDTRRLAETELKHAVEANAPKTAAITPKTAQPESKLQQAVQGKLLEVSQKPTTRFASDASKIQDLAARAHTYGPFLEAEIKHSLEVIEKAKRTNTYGPAMQAMVQYTLESVAKHDAARHRKELTIHFKAKRI